MKNIQALCVGLLVGSAVFGSISLLRAEPPQTTVPAVPAAQVGRYQLSDQRSAGRVWMLDTATGESWYWGGAGWTDAGNPATDRK